MQGHEKCFVAADQWFEWPDALLSIPGATEVNTRSSVVIGECSYFL